MDLYDQLIGKKAFLAVIGLGYVGLPIAVAFAEKVNVIGFDVSFKKIEMLKSGIDPTKEIGNNGVSECKVKFTDDEKMLKEVLFHIVAVPTPVNTDRTPDLNPIISASQIIGRNLMPGSIVVYESTVYPGVTEDICVPILEKESGLICGKDFKVGYSPERINPADKEHRLNNIVKVVSGMDSETLECVSKVYEIVALAGTYKASSIKVAEAAKVIENSQRDINIAFMNELSIIFNKMGIDTKEVLEAAGTKWNFLKFTPGLVGGHCIGVDPYYLAYKAEEIGYRPEIILTGRRVNDNMGRYIAENTVKKLIYADKNLKKSKIAILGFTFKENCPDHRNTKVIDIIKELMEYGISPIVTDPLADTLDVYREYGINLSGIDSVYGADAIIVAVAHNDYGQMSLQNIDKFFNKDEPKVLIDVKGIFDKEEATKKYIYWRL